MSSTFPAPARLACTATLQDLTTATPSGKVRKWSVRFVNVGAANAYGHVVMTDGTTVIEGAANYPVPYQNVGSAPDVEDGLVVPAGWRLQAKASASSVVVARAFNCVETDLADFT